jgi:hypothetical protein
MGDKYQNEFGVFADRPKVAKKLYDGKYIFAGLILFFALVTIPFWNNVGKAVPVPTPKLDTPAIQKLAEKDRKCVEPTPFMRANHMQMLVDWREEVVRTGTRDYTSSTGKKYTASLSNTCMECHSNKTQFCDQCHNYVAVTPTCWGCHLDKEKKLAEAK